MISEESMMYVQSCIGAMCRVMNEEKTLLFVGTFVDCDIKEEWVDIKVYGKEEVPKDIINRTAVNVSVRTPGENDYLLTIQGKCIGIADDFWRVEIDFVNIVNQEKRGSYRQPISGKAVLLSTMSDGGQREAEQDGENLAAGLKTQTCELVDISITGISFRAKTTYEKGDSLLLTKVFLFEGEEPYTFECIVQRISRGDGVNKVYGCRFLPLTSRDETRLAKDINRLQTEELSRAYL